MQFMFSRGVILNEIVMKLSFPLFGFGKFLVSVYVS